MPITARQAAGIRTRQELLDAAIGQMATSKRAGNFDEIAASVGLTKGAIYHHFGSVDQLVQEVFKESIRLHADRVVAASETGTGRERLQALIDISALLYGSDTAFYRLLLRLHVEAGSTRPALATIARRVQQSQRTYMAGLIRAGQEDGSIRADIDAAAAGEMVNAALQGMLVQQLEAPEDQRRAAERFGDLLEVLL
ncbi:MAG: TetR family transcriptional regulator [Actinobacteria bacterium]|nr:TetR family transcriptional regulator [Actinomycetota bacterium]